MKKIFQQFALWQAMCLLVVIALIGYPFASALTGASEQAPVEDTTITAYEAEFNVDDNGDMQVTEQLTVDFPDDDSHGIFRFFDRHDPNAPGLRREPTNISVEVDPGLSLDERLEQVAERHPYAQDEIEEARADDDQEALESLANSWYPHHDEITLSEEGWGRYLNVRIGRQGDTLPSGEHVYILKYEMANVLLPHQDTAQLNWNLIPAGWNQAIDQAELTVNLPGAASDLECAVGTETCTELTGDGTDTVTVSASNIAPRTPVAVSTQVASAPPAAAESLPWPVQWDPILGDSEDTTYLILGLAVVGLAAGLWLSLRSRDPVKAAPTASAPSDVGPAQAAYLLTKRLSPALATATIFHAAARNTITIERHDKTVTLKPSQSASYAGLDDITRKLALWVKSKPRRIDGSSKEGRKSGKWLAKQNGRVVEWAQKNDYLVKDRWWTARVITVVLAMVASVVLAVVRPSGTIDALAPALFAAFAIYSIRPSAKLRRTEAGTALAGRVAGTRALITDPSTDRNAQSHFGDYLPWAVAFACSPQWEAASQSLPRHILPMWIHAATLSNNDIGTVVSDTTTALDSAVSSSIKAYSASISPESSGGGLSGGVGGGGGGGSISGGGGGGGGSW